MTDSGFWTSERRTQLIELVNRPDPPGKAKLAAVFNCTPNAVTGMVDRLAKKGLLPERVVLAPRPAKQQPLAPRQCVPAPPKATNATATPVAPAAATARAAEGHLPTRDTHNPATRACCWPMWGDKIPLDRANPQFCGKPRQRGHRNYCDEHARGAVSVSRVRRLERI